jgi:monoamine oxidase
MSRRIGIVGGGLAGLYAAWLLERAGEDYLLLEARDRWGGRLLTVSPDPGTGPAPRIGAFDLGATWYWPAMQPELAGLVEGLALPAFRQHEEGELLVEGRSPGRVDRVPGFFGSPPSMRLADGMRGLVDALRTRLRRERLHLGQRAQAVSLQGERMAIEAVDASGRPVRHAVERVMLAIPPRLAHASLAFDVPLPAGVASDWRDSPTWMAPHAKYLAVYAEPFWRGRGLSGAARSQVGPMVEIHDASSPGGRAALFGFVGVPAAHRRQWPEASLRGLCRAQLGRLFGDHAAHPEQDWLQDWSLERFTATQADLHAAGHPERAAMQPQHGPWQGRLVGIASEWSPRYPGYVAGAVEAAALGVACVLGAGSGR